MRYESLTIGWTDVPVVCFAPQLSRSDLRSSPSSSTARRRVKSSLEGRAIPPGLLGRRDGARGTRYSRSNCCSPAWVTRSNLSVLTAILPVLSQGWHSLACSSRVADRRCSPFPRQAVAPTSGHACALLSVQVRRHCAPLNRRLSRSGGERAHAIASPMSRADHFMQRALSLGREWHSVRPHRLETIRAWLRLQQDSVAQTQLASRLMRV